MFMLYVRILLLAIPFIIQAGENSIRIDRDNVFAAVARNAFSQAGGITGIEGGVDFSSRQLDYSLSRTKGANLWALLIRDGQTVVFSEMVPSHYPFIVTDDRMMISVEYNLTSTGGAILARQIGETGIKWSSRLVGLGPISHSKYNNVIAIKHYPDERMIGVFGKESQGSYSEFYDISSGQLLRTIVAPRITDKNNP